MRVRDKEITKVKNGEIKRLEKTLDRVDEEENKLLKEFDRDILSILGKKPALAIITQINKTTVVSNGKVRYLPDTIKSSRYITSSDTMKYKIPDNFLKTVHKSYLTGNNRLLYENSLKAWFSSKTEQLRAKLTNVDSYEQLESILPEAYALASLALTVFHKRPNMILRDVQKLTGIAISEGDIAELGTGEGKTLSAVLPMYLMALRGKGAHLITANSYLARRDFEETMPIFEGLGLTTGYLPSNELEIAKDLGKNPSRLTHQEMSELNKKLVRIKQNAYKCDITYGAKSTFAFDYLRDNSIKKKEDMLQRVEKPGFALIDEVDDVLIDDAQIPYRIAHATPTYEEGMSLIDLCIMMNAPYRSVVEKVKQMGLPIENLSYDEASYIAKTFCNGELLPDQGRYQELAQLFFTGSKVLVTEDNMRGFKTGRDLYNAILDRNYNTDSIKNKYDVIYCREKKEFTITDKCYENFLKFSYVVLHLGREVKRYETKLLSDSRYKKGIDYIVYEGKVILSDQGVDKILYDSNYPKIHEDYKKYLSTVSNESAAMNHYLQEAVVANLVMKNGQDYTVVNGTIKTMKNGRIQEGSSYSNGLHQALEIKENIPRKNRTKENISSSSITQKDFYHRYDMFSGMTGTSSKDVFYEIYGKATVEIPKHAFYSYYGNRKVKDAPEPIGVDKKNTKFALTRNEKLDLILLSIIESKRKNPPQPVLLVVSDVGEIKKLERALKSLGLPYNTLTAHTPKDKEAEIIARAGRPGALTISTEMAGRGTDIRVGGDRDTILDIKTANHSDLWSKEEEKNASRLLSTVGLKVISSGYFRMDRIDRQLEGRTGRNGISGVTERFACPDDLKNIGVTSIDGRNSILSFFQKYKKREDGSLAISSLGYNVIENKVKTIQDINESNIKENIKNTQKLDSFSTKLVEDYRERRRKIICDEVNLVDEIKLVIENSIDAILSSYMQDERFSKKDLLAPISSKKVNINLEAVALETKKSLGVTIDPKDDKTNGMNLLELKNAVILSALQKVKTLDLDTIRKSLLAKYDYMISNLPLLLEHSFTVKNLTAMSMGMEGQADYNSEMAFYHERQRMILDANKYAAKQMVGEALTPVQEDKLEKYKEDRFGLRVTDAKTPDGEYDVVESEHIENNLDIIKRLKKQEEKIKDKNEDKMEKVYKKIDKLEEKGKDVNLSKLYKGLNVRPMMFINSMYDEKTVSKLVLVRFKKRKQEEEENKEAKKL